MHTGERVGEAGDEGEGDTGKVWLLAKAGPCAVSCGARNCLIQCDRQPSPLPKYSGRQEHLLASAAGPSCYQDWQAGWERQAMTSSVHMGRLGDIVQDLIKQPHVSHHWWALRKPLNAPPESKTYHHLQVPNIIFDSIAALRLNSLLQEEFIQRTPNHSSELHTSVSAPDGKQTHFNLRHTDS